MKYVIQIFITLVVFIILMNISGKVFNRIDPWLGIIAGFISICAFGYTLYRIWKRGVAEAEAGRDKKE